MLARLISPPSFNPHLEFFNRNKFNRLNLPRAINKNSALKWVKNLYCTLHHIDTAKEFLRIDSSLHIPKCGMSAIRYNSLRLSIALFASKNISCWMRFALQSKLKFTPHRLAAWLLNFTSQRAFLVNFKSCVLLIAGAIPTLKFRISKESKVALEF